MKLIFLDVDGVLNSINTRQEIEGYTFVEDKFILLLQQIVDATNAKIVLSSTWRRGWYCKDHGLTELSRDREDIRMFDALEAKLREFDLSLIGYTDDFGKRGQEIGAWLAAWQGERIESYVILDDMGGQEMRPHGRYLVQTTLTNGMHEKHVAKAIRILNNV